MENNKTASFDNAAKDYDDVFTHSEIGKLQRKRVYHWLKKVDFFKSTKKVFEVNCGTGYDAEILSEKGHNVIATDISEQMVATARRERNKTIEFYQCDLKKVSKEENFKKSEVLFSNFGGLNCLSNSELLSFITETSAVQKTGHQVVFVIMAKKCFMEDLYFLLTFQWKKMGRRNTTKPLKVNVDGVEVETHYHSPKIVENALKERYTIQLKKPVAFALPPSYLEPFFVNKKWLLKILNRIEKLAANFSGLASWADHYIIIAQKR